MRKVLIITSAFPPEGGGGVRRVLAFSRYLPQNGWQPVILTPFKKNPLFPDTAGLSHSVIENCVNRVKWWDIRHAIDKLEKKLPEKIGKGGKSFSGFLNANRTGIYPWLRRWLLLPDEYIAWRRPAIKTAHRLIEANCPSAIISIGPSHVSHLIGLACRKKWQLPWIADFKDPWTANPFVSFPSPLHELLQLRLEKKVLGNCSLATSVSESICDGLKTLEPSLRTEVLPNGFDSEDFSGLHESRRRGTPLRVIHAGALYGKRTPHPFLKALCYLRDKGITHQEVKVTFIGAAEQATMKAVESFELADFVDIQGHVPHDKAIDALNSHDIYLLLPGPGKGTITGKIFEYLAFKRPILCVGGMGGDLESLLLEVSANYPYHENDTEGIGKKLFSWVQQKKKGELIECRVDQSRLSGFDRKEQVNRLGGWLSNLCMN